MFSGHAEDLYATVSAGLARSRCPALARKLNCHPARKIARTILPSFLPSFLPSQSPTAKPSLSPSEDPTKGSSCRPGQSAARVQASFVPESDCKTVRGFYLSTYGGHSCALAVSTWQGRLPGPRLSSSCFRMRPGNMSVFYLLLCFQDRLKIFTPP